MFDIQGKYTTVHVTAKTLDESSMAQIYAMASHPAFEGSHCVVMPDEKYGYNRFTCTIHAELGGIIALHNSGTNADSVLVVRGDGSYASKPCQYCSAILKGHGINKVFYPEGSKSDSYN